MVKQGGGPARRRGVGVAVMVLLAGAVLVGCPVSPRQPGQATAPVWWFWGYPSFVDDQSAASLKLALERNIAAAQRRKDTVTVQNAQRFLALVEAGNPAALRTAIGNQFRLMRVRDPLLLTAYYEPELNARKTPDEVFRYPIYARPPDLLDVDPGGLDPTCQCRLQAGRLDHDHIVPYPSRGDIGATLAGRGLELAWTDDPFTLFSLHVQGSGQLLLPDGTRTAVRYAGTNGRPYSSLGRVLIERGYLDGGATWDRIRQVMGPLPDAERDELFASNQRFTFFKLTQGGRATGSYGTELVAERSVAVDPRLVPLGMIGYLVTPTTRRFVVAQDTGAAIREAHADLFLGGGPDAEGRASRVKETGTLYLLQPR